MACSVAQAARLNVLFRKYVGSGPVSSQRLVAVIRRETRAAEAGTIKVSRDLLRELRADRLEAGRIAKACKWSPFSGYSKHNRRSRRIARRSKRR